jgi:hypothetical protein
MKVVRLSASRTGRLYLQEIFLVLIFTRAWVDPRAMVRSEGNMSLKNPVTPRGIDPGTVRIVSQRLNHYATPGPITCRLMFWYSLQYCGFKCFPLFQTFVYWHGNKWGAVRISFQINVLLRQSCASFSRSYCLIFHQWLHSSDISYQTTRVCNPEKYFFETWLFTFYSLWIILYPDYACALNVSDSASRRGFIEVSFWRQRQSIVCGCSKQCLFGGVKGKVDIYSQITEAYTYHSSGCTKRVATFHFILIKRWLGAREYPVTRTNRRAMKSGGKICLYGLSAQYTLYTRMNESRDSGTRYW